MEGDFQLYLLYRKQNKNLERVKTLFYSYILSVTDLIKLISKFVKNFSLTLQNLSKYLGTLNYLQSGRKHDT